MPEQFKPDRCPDNVDDCIHRANFVEMHALDRDVMHAGLGLRQPPEDRRRAFRNPRRQARFLDQFKNVPERPMMLGLGVLHDRACRRQARFG